MDREHDEMKEELKDYTIEEISKRAVLTDSEGDISNYTVKSIKDNEALDDSLDPNASWELKKAGNGQLSNTHIGWETDGSGYIGQKNKSYNLYGGRGIDMCDEWKNSSDAFKKWAVSNGYQRGLELDRIDNDRGYSPENCRWVTKTQNLRNTRKNKYIEWQGEVKSLSEWCEVLGLDYHTTNMRVHRGWSFEKAISTPLRTWDDNDLTGRRFGRLIVKSPHNERTKDGRRKYICSCDCGRTCVVVGKYLRTGKTNSCGCLQKEFSGLRPLNKRGV
jgi:hypothetical protein